MANRQKLLSGTALVNFSNRYIAKDGKVIWLEWTSVYFDQQELVFAIAKDISLRKTAELAVEAEFKRFKSLAAHFKDSMEQDRKNFAYELHEELAQLVSALRLDIDLIASSNETLPDSLREKIGHAQTISGLLLKSIQRISFSVSPGILDDFGLEAALEWLCKEFTILNSIPCTFETSCDTTTLTREIQLDFFRICQEALMNVADHAQAANVLVTISDTPGVLRLGIADDGKGFAPDMLNNKYGLLRMRERAASIGADFFIKSIPGKGCIVEVAISKPV